MTLDPLSLSGSRVMFQVKLRHPFENSTVARIAVKLGSDDVLDPPVDFLILGRV